MLVRQSPEGAWQVLDIVVIETLTGVGEGREAAEAVAREYVAQHHHPTASPARRRPSDPRREQTTPPSPGRRLHEAKAVSHRQRRDGIAGRANRSDSGSGVALPGATRRRAHVLRRAARPSAIGLCTSGCCTPSPTGSSSSPRGRVRRAGSVEINRRTRREHFLPGGATGHRGWLEDLLEHATRIVAGDYSRARFEGAPREEAFVGATPRTEPRGTKDAVAHTRFLWIDVDRPEQLPALWALLAERPCHLLIESAGSGGMHAYWKLDRQLDAVRVNGSTAEPIEVIERANARLIHRLGV